MKNEKIIEAYDAITPDDETRERVKERVFEMVEKLAESNLLEDNSMKGEVLERKVSKENGGGKKAAAGRKILWMPKTAAAVLALVVVLAAGTTGYALLRYLSPDKVAEELVDEKLAGAFRSEDAVSAADKQNFGKYNVTFLGLKSGKNLTDELISSNAKIDRTYCVVAVERADGNKMPDYENDEGSENSFMVSPFIQGEKPWQTNIFYMEGGAISEVIDGVLYRIIDCDSLAAFADREVYLTVSDTAMLPKIKTVKNTESTQESADKNDAYIYNTKTGKLSRNEKYKGVNALFTLPLDKGKADKKRAKELLSEWKNNAEKDDEETVSEKDGKKKKDDSESSQDEKDWKKAVEYMRQLDTDRKGVPKEKMRKEFKLLKKGVQTVKPDKDGVIKYYWKDEKLGEEIQEDYVKNMGKPARGRLLITGCSGDGKYVVVNALRWNKDGTITVFPYYKKISEIVMEQK